MLNTIARTGTVLNMFTPERPHWGVTEVAVALGLSKSTAHDLLSSLAEVGLLQRTPDDRYRLGWRLLVMSRSLVNSTSFCRSTQSTIAEVANNFGATVTVGAWDGRRVVCVQNAAAPEASPRLAAGARLPGHASALGKLIMAQLPWSKVEERVGQYGLPALTESTVSSLDVFRRQLTDASRNCLATQDGELVEGQSCLAVGIRDSHRRVTAAVSICSTSERLHDSYDEFLLVLRRTARALADQGIPPAVPSARRRDAFGSVAAG